MLDFSFLRLEPDFYKAKSESFPPMATIGYFDQIQLLPTETYLQITNTKNGIAFAGNYAVYLVDCQEYIVQTITDKIAISEFIDNKGVSQIAFEIAPITTDHYTKKLFLKFVHTVSDSVWYSNPFLVTNYRSQETTRFDYKSYYNHFGTAYNIANYYQSIRLRCYFNGNTTESTSNQYTSINGKKVTSRVIQTEYEKYVFERIDNFNYRRINKLLTNQVVFVNGNRVTDKQTIESEDFAGSTNIFNIEFKCCINYEETFTPSFQIFNALTLTSYLPLHNYLLADLPNQITGSFNRNVTMNTGTIQLIDDTTETLIAEFNETGITHLDNHFSCDITGLITTNGSYKVRMSAGLFTSVFNEVSVAFEWNFTVSDGDFLNTDFDNNDFFTN